MIRNFSFPAPIVWSKLPQFSCDNLQQRTSFKNEKPGKSTAGHREAHSWPYSTVCKSSGM